jgi:hypothetical protein
MIDYVYKIQFTNEFILFLVSTADATKYHLLYFEFFYKEQQFKICKARINDFKDQIVDLIVLNNIIYALTPNQVV